MSEENPQAEIQERTKEVQKGYKKYLDDLKAAEKKSFDKGLGARIPQGRNPHTGKLQQLIRKAPKISRNEPCPCGSEKKYKQCCMNK